MTLYIFLGGPGSGKGTQAELLSEKLHIPHISTGQLFRAHLEKKTQLGLKVEETMKKGDLVSDEIVLEMLNERLDGKDCKNGAILDGVPRTLTQAELMRFLNITQVLYVTVDEEELIKRISGRRTCKKCGHIYHLVFNPPKKDCMCDYDDSDLYQRDEDNEKIVKNRINIYKKETKPLIDYYTNLNLITEINGNQTIEQVHREIMTKLTQNS